MAPTLSPTEAREAAATLDAIIEQRISLQLTPAVLAKLAAKGHSESHAREYLRQCAAKALLAEYGA